MKKITIIALHLGYGGIEKAIASLANMLCHDYEVNIISTYRLYDTPAFFIDDKVKTDYLIEEKPNKKEFIASLKRWDIVSLIREGVKSLRVLRLRKKSMIDAIKNIDSNIIISTRPFHNYLLGKYAKNSIIKIAWEHSHHNNNKKYINQLVKSCQNIDYLISVSKSLNDFYSQVLCNQKTICKHISLALDDFPKEVSKLNKQEVTAIGRLSREKGFLDLIDVFEIVNKKYSNWHLNIVGDGLEKENIENKIKQNKLDEVVTMHGFKNRNEIDKILLDSSIYVMTSFTESFGLVLIEAMSYGIPCISFSSAQGSLEIIDNDIDGFIIKNRDKQAMASKIITLIEDKNLRQKMGQKAHDKSLQFSVEKIKTKWVKLFDGEHDE